MTRDASEKALERLVGEARRDAVPPIEWDALERSLMARVAHTERAAARGSRARWVVPAALAALTALAAGGMLLFAGGAPGGHEHREDVQAAASPAARGNVSGDALAVGAVITSGREPVVVEHVNHVTWTLAPDGIAHLESTGDVIALSLDRGQLSAHVTKSPRPESFVVRVEKSRIAVHGTAFRVERLENTVRIEVTEGVVGIGPVAGGAGAAFELRAPGSAVVSFEGIRADAPASGAAAPATAPASPAAPSSGTETPTEALAEGKSKAAAPRAKPSPSASQGAERVIQAVHRCLSENTVARRDLHVTVGTHMSLRVQPSGRVGEALFAPPLAPPVQQCVDAKVGSIGFPASSEGFALDREIELER